MCVLSTVTALGLAGWAVMTMPRPARAIAGRGIVVGYYWNMDPSSATIRSMVAPIAVAAATCTRVLARLA